MTMQKTKRFPVFYTVYFIFIALVLVLIHIGLGIVKTYLADYESARPQYEAERVFAEYYASGDFSKLVDQCEVPLTEYETADTLCRYLTAFTDDKELTYSQITTGLDTSVKYIVKADNIKFSAFTLKESDKKTEKGFSLYEVSDFELYCAANETVSITAPKGYTVLVNGAEVPDTALSGEEAKDKSCSFMPEGVEGIVYLEYVIDDMYLPPDSVTVLSPDGRECTVTAEGAVFTADVLYEEVIPEDRNAYIIDAAKAISKYMQNDAMFYSVSGYIDPESELYEYLKTSLTYFVIKHNSYDFEDVRTSEFYQYDENTFSCRISFTHVLKRTNMEDYKDYIDTTFFFRRVGDAFLIYDRYNH